MFKGISLCLGKIFLIYVKLDPSSVDHFWHQGVKLRQQKVKKNLFMSFLVNSNITKWDKNLEYINF